MTVPPPARRLTAHRTAARQPVTARRTTRRLAAAAAWPTARRLAVVAGLAVAAVLLSITPASADTYRYWSFWEGTGAGATAGWAYQSAGPNTFRPADGSVDGWRFGVSADSASGAKPRSAPDFAAVCGGTPAVSGRKRVAVVIDYGTAADAPSGSTPLPLATRCATLAPDASSAQLLAQLSPPLRYNSDGILCAISGYPGTGCGDVVNGSGTGTTGPTGSTNSGARTAGWGVGAVLILVLAGAGYWQTRRRRRD